MRASKEPSGTDRASTEPHRYRESLSRTSHAQVEPYRTSQVQREPLQNYSGTVRASKETFRYRESLYKKKIDRCTKVVNQSSLSSSIVGIFSHTCTLHGPPCLLDQVRLKTEMEMWMMKHFVSEKGPPLGVKQCCYGVQ